jgi:oligoendopeptidase F
MLSECSVLCSWMWAMASSRLSTILTPRISASHSVSKSSGATFGHLYTDYYVYQYATGISGANALARRILGGTPGAVDAYFGFLKAGGARYSLDALRLAGVDMETREPVEAAFAVMAEMVERLAGLVG